MKRFALTFGINYAGTANELRGCIPDANSWAARARRMAADRVDGLLEKFATKRAMVDSIKSALGAAKPGDSVLICYSGHGTIVPAGQQSWVPFDFSWDKPDTWFTYDELDRLLMQYEKPGTDVIFISDSCHSRANPLEHFRDVTQPQRIRFLPPPAYIVERILQRDVAQTLLTSDQGDLLLSGCQKTQTSADANIGGAWRGAFSYAAEHALDAGAATSYGDMVVKAGVWLATNHYSQRPGADGPQKLLAQPFFGVSQAKRLARKRAARCVA